jgi:hypothetical protein|tara:strand:- start:3447 stop:4322 length:876 start_codon:yes stop_codon:yes gene_type:complete
MAFFLGNYGSVNFKRGPELELGTLSAAIEPDDISLSLNRVGFDGAIDNVIVGDRVDIRTEDTRGLAFIPASNWTSNQIEDTFTCFVHVNEAGGLRLYTSFSAAVNNDRSQEIALQAFTGDPIQANLKIRDVGATRLGNVTGFELNASREAIDSTTLNDYFRNQYNAGLLSGSGRMDCAFNYETLGVDEAPLSVMQTIQRLDLGCAFDAFFYLVDSEITPETKTVFYKLTAVITNVGITVPTDGVITATIDFVTTGELRLIFGRPIEYILKEDTDRIQVEQSVDYLLKEVTD